jgi:hypothetical protein
VANAGADGYLDLEAFTGDAGIFYGLTQPIRHQATLLLGEAWQDCAEFRVAAAWSGAPEVINSGRA